MNDAFIPVKQKSPIPMCVMVTRLTAVLAALIKEPLECDVTAPAQQQRCVAAVGHTLLLHLPHTTDTEIRLIKDDQVRILKITKRQLRRVREDFGHDSELFDNGTFKLGKVLKSYSGDYKMEEFHVNGSLLRIVHLHLQIQAPVSQPSVSQVCLSPQQMMVSCSCGGGDGVGLTLHLDGIPVMPTLRSHAPNSSEPTVHNVSVSLHGQVTGNLKCFASNNISREETATHLKSCRDDCPVLVSVTVGSAVVTGLLLLVLCLGVKRFCKTPRPTAVNEDRPVHHEGDVVYSAVTFKEERRNRSNVLNPDVELTI